MALTPGTRARLAAARALLDTPPPAPVPGQLTVPTGPRIGSLCTGYGGLDEAVTSVIGGSLAWVADPDDGPARILAHHHPDTPNLGDLRFVHWARTLRQHGPIDVLTGGYPCQPFSIAGQKKGTADARHIWPYIAAAIRVLRPRLCLFENVPNHLRIGFRDVLRDLAALGLDAEWIVVPASGVGATHQRKRVFLLAWPANADRPRLEGRGIPGAVAERRIPTPDTGSSGQRPGAGLRASGPDRIGGRRPRNARGPVAADPSRVGRGEGWAEPARQQGGPCVVRSGGATSPDPDSDGRERQQRREPGMGARADADGRSTQHWGRYAFTVARWEAATGRPAPWATDARGRLAPEFVEWMMGLPAGHVTAVPGLSRTQQLKALGNGVVPLQAAYAFRLLLDRAGLAHLFRLAA